MGLTCDSFEEVEMVTAAGEVIRARDDNEHRDLFWALRGGGGGNFGIVTRFLFRLQAIGPVMSHFFIQWKEPKEGTLEEKEAYLAEIVRDYLEIQAGLPLELTTAMGLRVEHRFMKDYYPLGLSGTFYGPQKELEEILKPFMERHPFDKGPSFRESRFEKKASRSRGGRGSVGEGEAPSDSGSLLETGSDVLLSDLVNEVVDFVNLGASADELVEEGEVTDGAAYAQKAPPAVTCLAPWPHKISSGFPKSPRVYSELARKAVRILVKTNQAMPGNASRCFMVLHGMPGARGAVESRDSAFYWRDKGVLVQFQAWWAGPCLAEGDDEGQKAFERDEDQYLCWIRSSRKQLESELEGAFINFADRDLPLETYYGGNLARLTAIKTRYDRDNVFHFPMSIPPDVLPLKHDAVTCLAPSGFEVVTRDGSKYEASRRSSNTRFDLRPLAIAYPRAADHVARCVRYCREHHLELRICSGGHQHEGMCSADDVLMVRLSKICFIEDVEGRDDQAWIGVGARLEDVYKALQKRRRVIAAGGCKSVNVGGLTLGGGWGLSARKFGLACDNVLAVEVVLADDRIVEATAENDYSDLFWAMLGGGGGNFGIVTRFLFRLHPIEPNLSSYKLYWYAKGSERTAIIEKWLAFQRQAQSRETTSYLVLYADRQGEGTEETRTSVYAGGSSYSHLSSLEEEVAELRRGLPTVDRSVFEALYPPPRDVPEGAGILGDASALASVGDLLSYAEDPPGLFDVPPAEGLDALDHDQHASQCRAPAPQDNCRGFFPHKVTSAFPKYGSTSPEDYEKRLAQILARFLEQHPVSPWVKSYISLYSMGGAIADVPREVTAFYYRDKPFVLQIESWWSYPEPEPEPCGCRDKKSWQQPYIEWVRSFRDALRDAELIKGAFINFVDKDLEMRNKGTKDRQKLLRHYYGGNLERLMESKAAWDPDDFFRFDMSIPPAE